MPLKAILFLDNTLRGDPVSCWADNALKGDPVSCWADNAFEGDPNVLANAL